MFRARERGSFVPSFENDIIPVGVIMIQCVDVGGSFLKFGICEAPGTVRALGKRPTPLHNFEQFARVLGEGFAIEDANVSDRNNQTLVITLPGVIDPDTGSVTCANVPCIDGKKVADELDKMLNRKVLLVNDADAFAMAEALAGAGIGHRIVFGVILGTGVGGGLVIDGKVLVGAGGLTGEWGHAPVISDPAFECGCGQRGCLNTVGSARGLERLFEHLHGKTADSETIMRSWLAGDASARQAIELCADLLSGPLAMVVNVVGASSVPAGGGLAKTPEFVALIDKQVRDRILRKTDKPLVVPAALPGDPGLIGAGLTGLAAAGGGWDLERRNNS